MTETLILQIAAHYGPWAALMMSAIWHVKTLLSKKRQAQDHGKEVQSLKDEYEVERGIAERHFSEFKLLYEQQRQGSDKRFEEVVSMYEKNVDLVRAYQKLAEDQMSIMTLTIERLKESNEIARNNLFCPQMRIEERTTRSMERGPK